MPMPDTTSDTPMPGEDPGALVEEARESTLDPATEMDIEANPQPEADSSLPPVDEDPQAQEQVREKSRETGAGAA